MKIEGFWVTIEASHLIFLFNSRRPGGIRSCGRESGCDHRLLSLRGGLCKRKRCQTWARSVRATAEGLGTKVCRRATKATRSKSRERLWAMLHLSLLGLCETYKRPTVTGRGDALALEAKLHSCGASFKRNLGPQISSGASLRCLSSVMAGQHDLLLLGMFSAIPRQNCFTVRFGQSRGTCE